MNATQNDITASDINIQHIEERNISEKSSSFCQNRKTCIIIASISSIVVIAGLITMIVLLTKKDKDVKPSKISEVPETDKYSKTDNIVFTDLTDLTDLIDIKNSDEEKVTDDISDVKIEKIEDYYITTNMKEGFKINSNEKLQIVGANYEHKKDTLIFGKSGKIFNVDEQGQIEGVTNDDLPLYYSFNGSIINGSYLFKDVKCFEKIDLSKMDGSKLVDASNMFENSDFEEIYFATENTNNLDTRYLQETTDLFGEESIIEERKEYFETSEIKSVSNMFLNCRSLKKIKLPPSFNVGRNAKGMFKGCTKLEEVNTISIISNEIEYMESMFEDCISLREIAFSNDFLTGEVKSLNNTFKNTNLSVLDISYLRLFNLQNTSNIFTGATIKGILKIGKYFSNDTLRDNFF